MAEIARLRVEIDEVTPAVIRRVEVPVTIRLDDLHFVLQIALGWQNCHPFEFRVGETAWGLLDRDDPRLLAAVGGDGDAGRRVGTRRHVPATTTCTERTGRTRSRWRVWQLLHLPPIIPVL